MRAKRQLRNKIRRDNNVGGSAKESARASTRASTRRDAEPRIGGNPDGKGASREYEF